MEITDIERDIQKNRSQLSALKAETKSCVSWIGPNGEMKISDPGRLKNLGDRIEALEKAIAGKVELAARLRSILGDRTVAELQAQVLVAENRIVGIKAQLDYDLKIQVAREVGIDKDHLVIGDHLFFQAGREAVSRVLKSEEFMELQQKAEAEIAGRRKDLAENGKLIEQAESALSELQLGATA
jgi:hypothetical protein